MTQPDVMLERIREWKKAHAEKPRNLDFDMVLAVLDLVNESSAVKVARNPLDEDHDWLPDTSCHNVGKVDVDDQGRLTLRIRHDKEEMPAGRMYDTVRHLKKKVAGGTSPVMLQLSETKCVQLTDVYSHALVRDSWAGLPFDVVFAYYERD